MIPRVAIRTAGILWTILLVFQFFRWEPDWPTALTAAVPAVLIAVVPALWGRIDRSRFGFDSADRIWSLVAAAVAAVLAVTTFLQQWPLLGTAFVAVVAAAAVAVPVWAGNGPGRAHAVNSGRGPVPRAVAALVAGVGIATLLSPVIAALGWAAAVAWNGCFFVCQEPDRPAALMFGAIAAALLSAAIIWGVAGWRGFPRQLTIWAAVPVFALALFAYAIPW